MAENTSYPTNYERFEYAEQDVVNEKQAKEMGVAEGAAGVANETRHLQHMGTTDLAAAGAGFAPALLIQFGLKGLERISVKEDDRNAMAFKQYLDADETLSRRDRERILDEFILKLSETPDRKAAL